HLADDDDLAVRLHGDAERVVELINVGEDLPAISKRRVQRAVRVVTREGETGARTRIVGDPRTGAGDNDLAVGLNGDCFAEVVARGEGGDDGPAAAERRIEHARREERASFEFL